MLLIYTKDRAAVRGGAWAGFRMDYWSGIEEEEDKKPKEFPSKGRSLIGPLSPEAVHSVRDKGRVVLPGGRRIAVTTSSDATPAMKAF